MTFPFYSLYVLELGGRHADIGFISAMGAVTRIVPTLFGGYLADALGRKKILYSMSFLLAVNGQRLALVLALQREPGNPFLRGIVAEFSKELSKSDVENWENLHDFYLTPRESLAIPNEFRDRIFELYTGLLEADWIEGSALSASEDGDVGSSLTTLGGVLRQGHESRGRSW